ADASSRRRRAQRFEVVALPALDWGPGHGKVVANDPAQLLGTQPFLDCVLAFTQPCFGGVNVGLAGLVGEGKLAHLSGELWICAIVTVRYGASLNAARLGERAVLAFLAAGNPALRRQFGCCVGG